MTNVIEDFNKLYNKLFSDFALSLNCNDLNTTVLTFSDLLDKSIYACCAVQESKCILHKCVLIIFGTDLDLKFRNVSKQNDPFTHYYGCFMVDGRFLTYPNLMLNNNIVVHNFFDKNYSKHCRRLFLYGNVNEDLKINRGIQLVFDVSNEILYARDVYAKDYIVNDDFVNVIAKYIKLSRKWDALNFIFDYTPEQMKSLVQDIKDIMKCDITFEIDSLCNKIVYKHSYLLEQMYLQVLDLYNSNTNFKNYGKRKKIQTILYPLESKKISDSIVGGKIVLVVSKSLTKQKRSFVNGHENNSNYNVEITAPPLKYRIGHEITRITGDNMKQDMLKHKPDFDCFVDSFFHGEMTVAGKKFYVCRKVNLPDVNYELLGKRLKYLEDLNAICTTTAGLTRPLRICFNCRPTKYYFEYDNLLCIYFELKRQKCPVEIKVCDRFFQINHYPGQVMLKKRLLLCGSEISVLLSPYEYHDNKGILKLYNLTLLEKQNITFLMSKLVQYYYQNHYDIFATIPVSKLIVSLTNLKNAMTVYSENSFKQLHSSQYPSGPFLVVSNELYVNDKMFQLKTIVSDYGLKTAEDPYIPHTVLPITLYDNAVFKLKGKVEMINKNDVPSIRFVKSPSENNYMFVDCGYNLFWLGVVISNLHINWAYDGKKFKIETCVSGDKIIYKMFLYLRQVKNQVVNVVNSIMTNFLDTVNFKTNIIYHTDDLEGLKLCSIHGQKGVLNESIDLSHWKTNDKEHPHVCLSPISYMSRQTNFLNILKQSITHETTNKQSVMFGINYMIFLNTVQNIYKDFESSNVTGHEKVEGTRLDQWRINHSFIGMRLTEGLHFLRKGQNNNETCGEFKIMRSLLHCNNIELKTNDKCN